MKAVKLFQVMFLVLLLAACSRTFFVNVEGDLDSGIKFCFYKNLSDKKPREHELREFGVQRLTGGIWKDVWVLEGPFDATCIDYGDHSESYKTLMRAMPLERGAEYRLGATDTKNPIGYAALTFKIDETGKPVIDE
jgi:hypothetical protein